LLMTGGGASARETGEPATAAASGPNP
jgi:hypothetical protein